MQLTLCDRCQFDANEYQCHDLATAGLWLWAMADQYVEGVGSDVLAGAPQADTRAQLLRLVASVGVDAPDVEVVHQAIHHLHDLGR